MQFRNKGFPKHPFKEHAQMANNSLEKMCHSENTDRNHFTTRRVTVIRARGQQVWVKMERNWNLYTLLMSLWSDVAVWERVGSPSGLICSYQWTQPPISDGIFECKAVVAFLLRANMWKQPDVCHIIKNIVYTQPWKGDEPLIHTTTQARLENMV